MAEHPHATTVRRYWEAAQARDWATFAGCLAETVVYDLPQTRERIGDKQAYLQFNQEYPGDWTVEVTRLHADDAGAVAWTRCIVGDEMLHGLHWFTFDADGLVSTVVDFWPEPYDPPAGREHLVERY